MLTALRQAGVLDGLDERFARALGRLARVDDERVLVAAALASRAPRAGHVGVVLAEIASLLATEVDAELPELYDPEDWAAAVGACAPLIRGPDEDRAAPLVWWHGALYLQRWWDYQQRLALAIRSRLGPADPTVDRAALEASLDALFPPDPRTVLQRRAAELTVLHHLTVVVGGPGTGKTAVVRRVLDLLAAPRTLLVAPTGKAAARLSESLGGAEASTIHRALGLRPGDPTPRRGPEDPLDADVVVVDEASMVDLPLMTKLVEAVPPTARLVLLGDPDQLASVEAGAVLGDLCRVRDTELAQVRLLHTWRYAPESGIGVLAEAIRAGDVDAALDALRGTPDLVWHHDPPTGTALVALLSDALADGYAAVRSASAPTEALAALSTFRVLCAHRHGAVGVSGVHAVAERLFEAPGPRPLMVTRNDPRLGVFNGDVGVELSGSLWLPDEAGAPRAISPALLGAPEVVWATTVHKSQGSEYDHVWVMLPDRPSPLLTRELLYTAVTRARGRVTLVGREELVVSAIQTVTRRMSGLADRIAEP